MTKITLSSQKRLQMQDIAKLAGVSSSTVSRALNDSPLVNAETKEKIAAIAKQYNYSINIGAQSLRLRQNKTVAVVVPFDPEKPQHVSDPFFLSMMGHIADELTKLGYYMLLSRVASNDLESLLEPYETGRAIGIIVIGQWRHHSELNLAVKDKPVVVWGAKMNEQFYVSIGSDNVSGGYIATEHLIKQGRKRIAFFGTKEFPEVEQRYRGYLKAHQDYNVSVDESLCIPIPFLADTVSDQINQLMQTQTNFDSIFACSDLIAMRAIGTIQKYNKSVPEDVAVVGYDDVELAAYFHPAITTVRQSIESGARSLVRALFAIIAGERISSEQLKVELLVRDSSQK